MVVIVPVVAVLAYGVSPVGSSVHRVPGQYVATEVFMMVVVTPVAHDGKYRVSVELGLPAVFVA